MQKRMFIQEQTSYKFIEQKSKCQKQNYTSSRRMHERKSRHL